jgi:small subunit ribosomal protein S8
MSNLSDPIADFLTRLRNAGASGKVEVLVPYSRIKAEIARILKDEGYIVGYEVETCLKFPQIKVTNKVASRKSAITGLKRISKPGLRKYFGSKDIPKVLGGMGISILSTPKGILSGREAKRQNVGGELLAFIW